ncbi:hypothetical protein BHE74_00004543, partial [Ensete ventricosum]
MATGSIVPELRSEFLRARNRGLGLGFHEGWWRDHPIGARHLPLCARKGFYFRLFVRKDKKGDMFARDYFKGETRRRTGRLGHEET